MTNTGQRQVARITAELRCPGCEYDLRGLGGAIVTCPECGTATDVARLVVGRWQGPWHQAPGYSKLVWPITWLMSCGLVFLCAGGIQIYGGGAWKVFAIMLTVAMVGWTGMLARLRGRMAGRAVTLSLVAHALMLGYIVGFGGVIWSIINVSRMSPVISAQAVWVVAAILFGAVVWACRRWERWVAGECIRHHLMEQARVDGPAPGDVALESDA